ncbi:MAG TPA: NAD(+)/NADH kinase [Vicinamibacteria bacterium]
MRTVGIFARPDLERAGPTLRELIVWLNARGVEACLEERTARLADGAGRFTVVPGAELAARAEALLVLGGDGTLLAASRLLGEHAVPVLAVNFGSLGFLTEVTLPELYPAMEKLLAGSYPTEERRLLRATVRHRGESFAAGDVLNDVVVTKASLARIIELDVSVDGLFMSAFRADGLIVSSPTGSTAYNLAAGGPIVHPTLPCVVLTPICPHMLSNRPLVVNDDAVIEVRLRAARECDVTLTLDGQPGPALQVDDVVTVTRSPRVLRLVKAAGRDYYEVLRTKLKWGEK